MDPSSSTSSLWVRLSSTDSPTVQQVGGKSFGLIQSLQQGFNVPDGFVLTTAFFQTWIEELNLKELDVVSRSREDCEALQAQCQTLSLTDGQRGALQEALAAISSTTLVAVRSSAPLEDSSTASLAGMYRSTLAVPTKPEHCLVQAMRHSFSSLFDYRVASLSSRSFASMDTSFAVVVQQQIDAAISGVAFSLDPVSNCYDEAIISANFGLGETVVEGLVTPDTYKVDKIKHCIISKRISESKSLSHVLDHETGHGVARVSVDTSSEQVLSDEQIMQVAQLVADVETARGNEPVDIEWCFDQHGSLYLLQARPITSYVKLFPEMVTRPGEIKQIYMDCIIATQGFSTLMSTMGLEIWGRMVEMVLPHYPHGSDGLIWELHGREYVIISNILAMYNGDSMLTKIAEASGSHVRRALETVDWNEYRPKQATQKNKYFIFSVLKFMVGLLPSIVWGMWDREKAFDDYNRVWNVIFERFSPDGVEDNRDDLSFGQAVGNVLKFFRDLVSNHMVILVTFYYKWRLERMFASDPETQSLLVALNMDLNGNPTSEMGHAMVSIAGFSEVQEAPSGRAFVEKLARGQLSLEVTAAVKSFVAKFGCRGMQEIDIATPRSYEDLAALIDRIKQIDTTDNQIMKMVSRKQEAMETLLAQARAIGCEGRFQYYAQAIQEMGGYREHPKYVFVFMLAHLRRRALKLAEQFVADGRLPSASSIFDLTLDQVDKAERDPTCNLLAWIEQNTAPCKSVAHIKDWPLLIDSRGRILRGKRDDVEGGLGGDPISPGIASGRARVLHSPNGEPLVRGEILVTKAAEPSWTPIFINASAVVLEVGGPTQHGAIIAREYGIPCVSGVENATKLIKDGQMIEVDGASGIVKILDDDLDDGLAAADERQ